MSERAQRLDADETQRNIAESIIAGEYKSAVVLLEREDGSYLSWRDGSLLACIGLIASAHIDFTRPIHESGPDESD